MYGLAAKQASQLQVGLSSRAQKEADGQTNPRSRAMFSWYKTSWFDRSSKWLE